ncbi:MAG: hypothetical protein QHJ81_14605 [Anaerolineae bacterium]|nr:hypothetical protein [Anaerolineae bacterium]
MSPEEKVRQLVLAHELQRWTSTLANTVQSEARELKQHLEARESAPHLTQVRGLANALAPLGAEDSPERRLARLHELVAGQLQRRGQRIPSPMLRMGVPPDSFWVYVAGRLAALRSGDQQEPGEVEKFWALLQERYGGLWPAEPDAATGARVHLRLAEAFVYHLVETWEYSGREAIS